MGFGTEMGLSKNASLWSRGTIRRNHHSKIPTGIRGESDRLKKKVFFDSPARETHAAGRNKKRLWPSAPEPLPPLNSRIQLQPIAACAAASRAIGTRKGEQLT